MNIIQKTAKINSIFLAILLIAGTFAAVYPSFISGIQAQSEYGYENRYGYDENNYNYNSAEYPPSSEYPSTEYESDRYNPSDYSSSPSYEYPTAEYPQPDYESNQEYDYYKYPPKEEEPISADIVVPIDFETIQESINAADEGDVIKVLPGTYTEQITISKSLTIIGSGAKSTIIEAPDVLNNGTIGVPFIVEIFNDATVSIKGFTISGPETETCGNNAFEGLVGVSIQEGSTLNLDASVIQDCTFAGIRVGAPPFLPNGPQIGHATITKTDITDYRAVGIVALTSGSTLTITKSNIIGFDNSTLAVQTGILVDRDAKGIITHNKISNNICQEQVPRCGKDWINDLQGFGISFGVVKIGSTISNNYFINNDVGIGVFGPSGCCIIDQNKLTDNLVFSIVVGDSEHTISNTKIFGGDIGVLAAAVFANTTATLDHVKIVGAEIPIQALSTGNLTAAVNVLSPSFFQP